MHPDDEGPYYGYRLQFVLVGARGVGKTSIMTRFVVITNHSLFNLFETICIHIKPKIQIDSINNALQDGFCTREYFPTTRGGGYREKKIFVSGTTVRLQIVSWI